VTKEFIRLRKRAGLRQFRLHDRRHFMATQMLDAGVPVPVVAARLAPARASTTLNVYAHAVPGATGLLRSCSAAAFVITRHDEVPRCRCVGYAPLFDRAVYVQPDL